MKPWPLLLLPCLLGLRPSATQQTPFVQEQVRAEYAWGWIAEGTQRLLALGLVTAQEEAYLAAVLLDVVHGATWGKSPETVRQLERVQLQMWLSKEILWSHPTLIQPMSFWIDTAFALLRRRPDSPFWRNDVGYGVQRWRKSVKTQVGAL